MSPNPEMCRGRGGGGQGKPQMSFSSGASVSHTMTDVVFRSLSPKRKLHRRSNLQPL